MDACLVAALGGEGAQIEEIARQGEVRTIRGSFRGEGALPQGRLVVAEVSGSSAQVCMWAALDLEVLGQGWAGARAVGVRGWAGPPDKQTAARLRAATGFDGPAPDPKDPRDAAQFAPWPSLPDEALLQEAAGWVAGPSLTLQWRPGPAVAQRDSWSPDPACPACAKIARGSDLRGSEPERIGSGTWQVFRDQGRRPLDGSTWLVISRDNKHAWLKAWRLGEALGEREGWTWFDYSGELPCVLGLRGSVARALCSATELEVAPDAELPWKELARLAGS